MNPILTYFQPGIESYYWLCNILDGIRSEASALKLSVSSLKTLENDGNNDPVCIIGTANDWLYETVQKANANNYRPLLISAGSPTFHDNSCSLICFDLYESTMNCIKYLLNAGRRRIAALGFRPLDFCDLIKQKAFNDAIDDFGLTECRSIPFDDLNAEKFSSELDFFVGSFDAVICSNDTLAVFLIKMLKVHGYDVPRSLYVIGMGNSNIGQDFMVPLTSVLLDYNMLGRQAVRLSKYIANNSSLFHTTSYLRTNLIIRDSTDNTPFEETLNLKEPKPPCSESYKSRTMNDIIEAEKFLQGCDDTDRKILIMLMKGLTYEEIASKLFIHIRTLSYRKLKMIDRLGVKNRKELCEKIKDILYT